MSDREKVIKGLECCGRVSPAYENTCHTCPYEKWTDCRQLKRDALELLKELEQVVRCKSCMFHDAGENEVDAWNRCRLHSINTDDDNYCSWAVNRDEAD